MLDGMSDYSRIKDRKSPIKGSRPSVSHGTNFLCLNVKIVKIVCLQCFDTVGWVSVSLSAAIAKGIRRGPGLTNDDCGKNKASKQSRERNIGIHNSDVDAVLMLGVMCLHVQAL